jgi:hypothetical protein
MSEWITDRKPTTLDSKGHRVWVMDFGAVLMTDIDSVTEGQPISIVQRMEKVIAQAKGDSHEQP